MPLITETYYLSLTQDNRGILRLRCSQDDTLRTVNLKLYNNGSIFVIPSGVSASISGVKQNGAVFSKPCTISQDRENVVLQLSSDITSVDGIIVVEIVLIDGEGGRLGTSNFIIQVEKNPIRAGVVQDTETPIEYINDFIEKIQTLTARLNNLITPNGDASLAEVVDARIGVLDSTTYQTTYQTLGARLNAEFKRLSNALTGITILKSTGDITDRTSEILSKLNVYGTCKLGKGDFYVKNLVMPEDTMLVGSGNSTRIVLLGSETNTYIVKPNSGCIIENISFYGGFTGTYSELIASSNAKRHCIILDKFNDVNSENVILGNISIENFVGSAIVQRYTTGCHCKDIIINMCYAGIDISNASYDGRCANVYINDTKFGVVQNGSNFVFSGCILKDSAQHIMSDQQNTECTFSSCTFFDSSLETTARLANLSNARSGFVFDNCMFDSSLSMTLNACDGIVIKGTNFVGSDTFAITVSNGRNTLLFITDCIADVEPTVTNAGTAARITSCYLKDGTAWTISEVDITVDDELSDESENPVQNKVINREISQIKVDLGDKSNLKTPDKTNIVSAINSLNGIIRIIANRDTSWAGIKENIKTGYGEILYPVGTDFSVSCPSGAPYNNIVFTVVNHRVENDEPIMTLLMKRCIYEIQFDAIQAAFVASEAMAVGTYHFKLLDGYDTGYDGGKYVQFTIVNPLVAGDQIVITWGYNQSWIGKNAYVYHAFDATPTETCVMSEGQGGTYLGVADGSSTNLNHTHRLRYGSNNWKESAVREWLNSDAQAGAWQTQQTRFQRPCSYASSKAGFISYLDPSFVAAVRTGTHLNRTNQVFDLLGTKVAYSTDERFFLLSNEEIGFTSESGIVCGSLFSFYDGANNGDRIKYDITNENTARYWWLRTPTPSTAGYERFVTSSGALGSGGAYGGNGAAAACEI